jgi:hypothetical protein
VAVAAVAGEIALKLIADVVAAVGAAAGRRRWVKTRVRKECWTPIFCSKA